MDNCQRIFISYNMSPRATIAELSSVVGPDFTPHTTELSTLPAPGLHISYGPLTGLKAWRFVTQLDESRGAHVYSSRSQSGPDPRTRGIMVNFILDDEFPHSSIPPEALRVLRHPMSASHAPGMIVTLIVQGLRTKFVVGVEGEAGRLNADWMKKGGLAVDLDDSLDAPVLYVADGDQSNPRTNLPRTIKQWFRNNVKDLPLNRGSSSADTGQVPTRREHGYAPWIYSEFETRSNPNSRSLWGHHNPQFPGNENPSSSLYSSQPPPRSADRPITSFDSRPPPRYSFSQGHMSLFPPSSSGHRTTTFDTYLHPSAVVSPEGGGALLHDDLLHPPSSAPSRLSFDTDHSPAPPPYADH